MLRSNKAHEPLPPRLRSGAREPQLPKPERLEPTLQTKRNHSTEEPAQRSQEQPPLAAGRETCAKQQRLSLGKKKSLLRFRAKLVSWLLRAGDRP